MEGDWCRIYRTHLYGEKLHNKVTNKIARPTPYAYVTNKYIYMYSYG